MGERGKEGFETCRQKLFHGCECNACMHLVSVCPCRILFVQHTSPERTDVTIQGDRELASIYCWRPLCSPLRSARAPVFVFVPCAMSAYIELVHGPQLHVSAARTQSIHVCTLEGWQHSTEWTRYESGTLSGLSLLTVMQDSSRASSTTSST